MSKNHRTQKFNLLGSFPLREDCLSVCCWESLAGWRSGPCRSDSLVVLSIRAVSFLPYAIKPFQYPDQLARSPLLALLLEAAVVALGDS